MENNIEQQNGQVTGKRCAKNNSKKSKVILILLIVLVLAIVISGILAINWYNSNLEPVSEVSENIRVEVESGSVVSTISEMLEKEGVIKNATVMRLYCKLNDITNLQAGKYDLNPSEDMATVIAHIVNGEVASDEIKITFIEGKTVKDFAKVIAKNTKNTEEDVFNLLEDEEYIDYLIEKYWFITDEIKNEDIYYSLEGYLLPDTYIFENDEVGVKTIFSVMLNYMEKYLDKYKDSEDLQFTIHQTLTLASMAEKEANSLEDRKEVVGVFLNRISKKMSLGSDVTTYYAAGISMGERDLYQRELDMENPYNTRGPNMEGKIPEGPICNPSKAAIEAAIEYTETDALYFVADKYGDVYFTKNNQEHVDIIQKLKDDDLWYVYE